MRNNTLPPSSLWIYGLVAAIAIGSIAVMFNSGVVKKYPTLIHADVIGSVYTVTIDDYMDNIDPASSTRHINLTAFWQDKEYVYVALEMDNGVKHAEEIGKIVQDAVHGHNSQSDKNYTGWHLFMHSVLDPYNKHLHLLILDDMQDADVVIRFTNLEDDHGLDAYGRTMQTLDSKKTNSLSFGHISVFEADKHYEEGLIQSIVEHELGHALGLKHSSSLESIMYPRVVIRDDRPITAIGECEYRAIKTLYVDSKIGQIPCD